jgi:hypothetical protein
MTPQGAPDTADGVTLGQMALHKEFAGDLTGSGQGVMLTAMTAEDGSAGYVAVERVSGTLHGLSGSFVLQHTGHMDRGAQQLTIMVVAGSGSGALTGMRGSFALEVVGDEHRYSLTYSLPAP